MAGQGSQGGCIQNHDRFRKVSRKFPEGRRIDTDQKKGRERLGDRSDREVIR